MTLGDPYVPLIVIGIVVMIVFLGGRLRTGTKAHEPTSGAELIQRLQATLGISIVVESVESSGSSERGDPSGPADAVTIRVTFMSGRHSATGAVSGPTESDAWAAVARAAIAWRNSDFDQVPMWWGA